MHNMTEHDNGVRVPVALLHALIHDIRNPLTAVMGYAQLIRGASAASGDEKSVRMVDRLNAACWEMRELLTRVSTLLKLDRGERAAALTEFDVRQSAHEIADLMMTTFDRTTVVVDDGGKRPEPCPWRGDEGLWQMAATGILYHLATTSDQKQEIRVDVARTSSGIVATFRGSVGYLPTALEDLAKEDWKTVAIRRETRNPDPGFLFSFVCRSLAAMGARLETEGVPESAASSRGPEKRIYRVILT